MNEECADTQPERGQRQTKKKKMREKHCAHLEEPETRRSVVNEICEGKYLIISCFRRREM